MNFIAKCRQHGAKRNGIPSLAEAIAEKYGAPVYLQIRVSSPYCITRWLLLYIIMSGKTNVVSLLRTSADYSDSPKLPYD